MLPQLMSMFLLYSLLTNCVAIMAPLPIAAGSLKPSNTRMVAVLLNVVLLFVMPLVIAPTLLPLGIEFLLEYAAVTSGVPWALLLSLLMGCGVLFFYRWLVGWQGVWLHSREQRILEIVAARAE